MMPSEIGNTVARLRRHRGTLLVFLIGIAALAFVANDARNQRLRAGINDDCAHAQYAMQMYPMRRCYSIEEFINMHRGNGPVAPTSNDGWYVRSEENSDQDGSACDKSAEASSSEPRPSAPGYVYNLLRGYECNEPEDRRR